MGWRRIEVNNKDDNSASYWTYRIFFFCKFFSTLQLLLPNDISEDLFGTLVGMVPHVFRVANAKVLVDNTK